MKNKKTAICFGMTWLLMTLAGCGSTDANLGESSVETISMDTIAKENDETVNDNIGQGGDEAADSQDVDNLSETDFELDGEVESIGNNSVVINKIFHPSATTAVSYEQADEKVLITVYFSEDTDYEVWNVKNSGVNGDSDVTRQSGTFSDIKEHLNLKMTGSYEGNDFHAKQVIIYNYI